MKTYVVRFFCYHDRRVIRLKGWSSLDTEPKLCHRTSRDVSLGPLGPSYQDEDLSSSTIHDSVLGRRLGVEDLNPVKSLYYLVPSLDPPRSHAPITLHQFRLYYTKETRPVIPNREYFDALQRS